MGIEVTCGFHYTIAWGWLYEGWIALSTGYSDFSTVVKMLEK
jgi:hypothetical protein